MITVKNVSKKYKKTLAVDNISFNLEGGQVGVLIGPNGAGKSTTIKSIVGLLRFDGNIEINGIPNTSINAKKEFAYVPEMPYVFPLLTVREHLIYMSKAYGMEVDNEKIDEILEKFDLKDKENKYGSDLSKGMIQKVSLCAALIIEPKVILLDEPMVGLDPKAIKELKNVINELKEKNVTILISTHMLEMVEEIWDRLVMMDKGHVIGVYDKDSLGNTNLEEMFFKLTGDIDE